MQRNIMRYMNILKLAGEIIDGYGKFPDPADIGAQKAKLIYTTAFGELVRQGMPCDQKGEMTVIKTDGEEYAVLTGSGAGDFSLLQPQKRPSAEHEDHPRTDWKDFYAEHPHTKEERHRAFKDEAADLAPGTEVVPSWLNQKSPDEEYYNDDNLDETYVHPVDELEDGAEDEEDEEKEIDAADVPEEEEETEGAVENNQENETEEEEGAVEVYSAVNDDVSIHDTEEREIYPGEPEGDAEPDPGEPPMMEEPPTGPKEPELEGPDEPDEPDEPDGSAGPGPENVPHDDVMDNAMPPSEDTDAGQDNVRPLEPQEMGPSLHRNDFTYNSGLLSITAPNGTSVRARILSMPIRLDEKKPEFFLLCALENKGRSYTRSGQGSTKLDIDGYKGVFSASIEDGRYQTQFELGKEFTDRGVKAAYVTSSGGNGTGGHVVCRDDDDEVRVHILPTRFKDTKSGDADSLLYYLEKGDYEAGGTATKKKPIRFEYEGIMVECRCKWKDDILHGYIGPAAES